MQLPAPAPVQQDHGTPAAVQRLFFAPAIVQAEVS
jgi:hypothetical protein